VVDAQQNRTTFAYDLGNRLTGITYPDTTSVSFAYDGRGRRTSVTDQNGKVTSYAYDDADRLTSVTDAAHNVTTYAYDLETISPASPMPPSTPRLSSMTLLAALRRRLSPRR
jgi:YD repeat-containing protein